ncbi:MAG TPA: glycosyltransferase family 4 protein [Methylomirabilota bacterium]
MRIAQVAPLFESVPPQRYGGTERVVSYLTEELVRRGHDVTLFASGDSRTRATLVPVVERPTRLDASSHELCTADTIRQLDVVAARADDFDVIHWHVDSFAFPIGRRLRTPSVHTLHGRLDLPHLQSLFRHFHDVPLVSISDAQRRPLESCRVRWAATVYHGQPLARYPFRAEHDGYLAFLGRCSPEKQLDVAIEVAKRVGLPLRIAAKVDHKDRDYFHRVIAPQLDDPLIDFHGEIGEEDKAAFLGGALALLFPIDWPEPFGLVMVEAMACGTPVVARPCGAVPEVVVDGRTGFIGSELVELVEAVKRIDEIDRAECRRHVEERFSVERMTEDYEAVYGRLAARRQAA